MWFEEAADILPFRDRAEAGRRLGAMLATYAASSDRFKHATTEEQWSKLLGAIHRKLGTVKNSELQNWRAFSGPGGTSMEVIHKTQFEKSEATEDFNWLFVDGKPELLVPVAECAERTALVVGDVPAGVLEGKDLLGDRRFDVRGLGAHQAEHGQQAQD